MKTRKLLTALLAVVASVCCAFGLVACGDKAKTTVTLDKAAIELTVGETQTLTATVSTGETALTWFSSDETIATVADGVVTAVKEGKTKVTVLTASGVSAVCSVTVKAPIVVAVTGVTLDKDAVVLKEGANTTLTATVLPADATNKKVTWTSSEESVATVADGVVTAVKGGSTTITATTEDGSFKATCEVTVVIAVAEIKLDQDILTMLEGTSHTIIATVLPTDATNKKVMWASSEESVATVADGVVTAVKEGSTIITATTEDGSFAKTCRVTVKAPAEGNTKALAKEIEWNSEKEAYEETSANYGDFDTSWLKFTAISTGKMRICVQGNGAYSQVNTVVLYDNADTELQQATEQRVVFYRQVTVGEVYYVKLSSAMTSYAPTAILEMVQDGAYQDIAKTMTFDVADKFTLAAGKNCWYKFTLAEATIVSATLGAENANIQFKFDNAKAGVMSVSYYTAGTYYVQVTNLGKQSAEVSITFTAQIIADLPEGTVKEKPFQATATYAAYESNTFTDATEYWFTFTLSEAKTVEITFVNKNAAYVIIDYTLYGSDNTEIATGSKECDGGNETVAHALQAGTYLVKTNRSAGIMSYAVQIKLQADGSCLAGAVAVDVGKSCIVTARDYWISVRSTSAQSVVFYSTGDNTVTAQLCDANGTPTDDTDINVGKNFRIDKSLKANVTYYLHVTTTDANPEFTVGIAKPASNKDVAEVAHIGQSYSVTASSYAIYWMTFTPTEDTELNIHVSGSGNITTNVLDFSQETPNIGTGSGGYYSSNYDVKVTLTANKTYYITFNGNCTVQLTAIKDGYAKSRPKTVTFDTADSATLAANEVCWYKFTLSAPAEVTATVSGDAEVTFEGKTTGETSATYLAAGDYYVTVTNKGAASTTFTVTFAQRVLTEADMPEGTIKSKAFQATGYNYVDTYESIAISEDLEYWFTFTLADAKTIGITFVLGNSETTADMVYVLYKGDTEVANASQYTYGKSTVKQALEAGTYYLKVNRTNCSTSYTVQIKLSADGSCKEGAITASIGSSYNVTAQDYWFIVTVPSNTEVIFYSTGDNTVTGDLCWSSGSSSGVADSDESNNFRLTKESTTVSMTYYLHVTTTDDNPNFTVYFAKPGSSKDMAIAVTIGEEYTYSSSSASENCFYAIVPSKTCKVKFTFSKVSGGYYDTATGEIICDDTSIATMSLSSMSSKVDKTIQLEQGKTYYFKVSASSGMTCKIVTEQQYGDSAENAQAVELGKTYSVTIEKSGNNYPMYYFSIELTETTTVKISSSGSNSSGVKRQAIISDANDGTLTFCAAGEDNNFSAEYEFAANTKYLVKVGINAGASGFSGSSHSYSVKFELPPKTVDVSTINAEEKTLPITDVAITQGEHWYKVTASEAYVYIHALNSESGLVQASSITYEIYNASGELEKASDSSVLSYYLDGTYYIKVDYKGADACTFKITFSDPTE